ncbi:MAG: hypothetical protein JXQ90_13780 [Cyclobacteriaceae bacterium]
MTKEELKETSTEELTKRHKNIKMNTTILAVLVITVLVTVTYEITQTNEFNPLVVVAIALSTVLMRKYRMLRMLKEELLTRGNVTND